jgi:hypothetical protein
MNIFTSEDIGDGSFLPNSTACAYEIEIGRPVPGHAICQPVTIATVLVEDRIKEWIVHCLNIEVAARGRKVVNTDLRTGVEIRLPVSPGELDD